MPVQGEKLILSCIYLRMKKILLIDDDLDDAVLFREALEEINPEIRFNHFEDGTDALQKLNLENSLPDLIFLDINMPVISGWECLDHFKRHSKFADIPIIMYTTSNQQKEKDIAEAMGAVDFITKPDDFRKLKEVLESKIKAY